MNSRDEQARVLEDLESGDDEIRRLAVERLSELPAREAIPRLVERLGDESWRVRKAAVERLVGCAETADVARALIQALADGDNPGRRNSAVEALVARGSSVVPALVDALPTDDIDVRKLIVDSLAGIGDARARQPLIDHLADPDANVRAATADALGLLGGHDAAAALQDVAVDASQDHLVRFSALRALGRLESRVPSATLADAAEDVVLRPAAFALLAWSEDDGAPAILLKGLSASSRASREAAMQALLARVAQAEPAAAERLTGEIRDEVAASDELLEFAIDQIEGASLPTRLMLVQFLGLIGTAECVIPILESGSDEAVAEVAHATLESLGETTEEAIDAAWDRLGVRSRRDACELLARTGGRRADARLASLLDDSDAELRAAAARALGARGAAGSLGALVRRLEYAALDEEPEAEDELEGLVTGLVELAERDGGAGRSQTIDQLAVALESSAEPVRRAATRVLCQVARPEDAERVIGLLKDPSAGVRRLAVAGLPRLAPEVAAEPLRLALADESALVRVAAAGALGGAPSEGALEDLRRLLADEDPRVRAAAVRGIGQRCTGVGSEDRQEAAGWLASSLQESGRSGMVAMAALEALEAIGGSEAARVALAGLESEEPEVAQAAVTCVGRHGDAEILAELIPSVQHPSWAVRGEAIQTLGDRRVSRALPAILRRLELEQDGFVRDVIVRALRRLEEEVR